MQKKLLIITGISGMLAVVLGAFGAHILSDKLTAGQLITYHTGIEYHFYHTLALLAIASMVNQSSNSIWLYRSAGFFVLGIIFFSGSIYLLACKELLSLDAWVSFIGPLTPFGGLLLIIGWLLILIHSFKKVGN